MSKKLIIGVIVAVVLVAAGGGAYYFFREDSASDQTDHSKHSDSDSETQPVFEPKSTKGLEFEAVYSGGKGEAETRTKMIQDDKGNFKLVTTAEGTNAEFYQVGKDYVSCSAGRCIKITSNESAQSSTDQYQYSESDIKDFQKQSTYEGKVSCSSGTCDKWTTVQDDSTSTFLIDSDGRINQVSGKSGGTVFKVNFTYKDVPTIKLPDNVTELPSNLQDFQR